MTWFDQAIRRLTATLMLAGLGSEAAADDVRVDLELVLAVDISLSMDLDELRLQRRGYIAAFRHPDVIRAIQSGGWGRIAVTYLEWGGEGMGKVVLPWALVADAASAHRFADALEAQDVRRLERTSIADALLQASALFASNGYTGVRRVIDMSGDGPNNQGPAVRQARDTVVGAGVTINGLPILRDPDKPRAWYDIDNLDDYYEDCVIGGFGAFIVRVRGREEFASAIRRKLLLEISGAPARLWRAAEVLAERQTADCLIGEKLWDSWLGVQSP